MMAVGELGRPGKSFVSPGIEWTRSPLVAGSKRKPYEANAEDGR